MTTLQVVPGQRINDAISKASKGDLVRVAPGSYPEDVVIASKAIDLWSDPMHPAIIRSLLGHDMPGGSASGFAIDGPKVPLLQSVALTKPDDASVGPVLATLPEAKRNEMLAKKWKTLLFTLQAYDGPNFSLYTVGVKLVNCRGTLISDLKIRNHTAGVSVEKCQETTVLRAEAAQCRVGLRLSKSTLSVIQDSRAHDNLGSGFELNGGADCRIENPWAKDNGLHGVVVNGQAIRALVHNGWIGFCGRFTEMMPKPGSSGVNFYDVGIDCSVNGTQVDDQTDAGAGYDGNGFIADTSSFGVRFLNVKANRCVGAGIALTLTDANYINGVVLVGCKQPQIRETRSKGNVITKDNKF